MDVREYTWVVAAFGDVPDPRQRRGCRYPWINLLVLISLALASGERHGRGIGQWVRERAVNLHQFGRTTGELPSEATLRRALRAVDVAALEARLAQVRVTLPAEPAGLTGQALDGKTVRGVGRHGRALHLVGLVSHQGVVHRQVAVAEKTNEITAAPQLLADRDLHGVVITTDALLTQRALAQQIRAQGGHYLMLVKANQPEMHRAIADQFAAPHWLPHEQAAEYARHHTLEKGHGRVERRILETCTSLRDWLRWPAAEQVCRRTCRRVLIATGEIQEEVSYAVTSLPPELAGAAELERLWRGHWAMENKVHYVRDVTLGEDAGQAYRGNTPQALAALRNVLLNLMRAAGWTQMADALRHYGAALPHALDLLGFPTGGL